MSRPAAKAGPAALLALAACAALEPEGRPVTRPSGDEGMLVYLVGRLAFTAPADWTATDAVAEPVPGSGAAYGGARVAAAPEPPPVTTAAPRSEASASAPAVAACWGRSMSHAAWMSGMASRS